MISRDQVFGGINFLNIFDLINAFVGDQQLRFVCRMIINGKPPNRSLTPS